jgi:hypothetical protein
VKLGDAKDVMVLAGLAVGGFLAWKFYNKLAEAGDAASKTVADAYVRATAGPVIQVLGRVVLPDGRKVPMADIKIVDTRNFLFTYGAKRYKLLRRRPDNDYDSALAGFRR